MFLKIMQNRFKKKLGVKFLPKMQAKCCDI